ncbi:MAG: ribonuclease HI family protein [Candidatus Aenigmatarchaeota archaeon]
MVEIYTDGASRGNPGPASYAFLILEGGEEIERKSGYIGKTTNNRAEYTAVVEALKKANELGKEEVELYSDSNLLVRQLSGDWKVKSDEIRKLYDKTKKLMKNFEGVEFVQVPRENKRTKIVDGMCNEVLDSR